MNKVSIIIPTHNRSNIISETIDSVISQSYENWECLIVDDSSNDNTKDKILKLKNKFNNVKYHILPKKRGANFARNYGLLKSTGNYITFLDSDDCIHRDKLKIQVSDLIKNNSDFTICQSLFFSDGKSYSKSWNKNLFSNDLYNDFLIGNIGWSINAPMYKKSFLIQNDLFFDELLKNAQDFDFHIRVLSHKSKISYINKDLVYIREHAQTIKNTVNKGFSKLIVYKKILVNSFNILNTESIKFINKEININIGKTLLDDKPKFIIDYSVFIFRCKVLRKKIFFKTILKLFFYFFYKISGKGYSVLKK